MRREHDAVVIGAGPSGAAAAAALAAAGRDVLVLEKDRFPRRKVCGEFLSGSARGSLEALEALDAVAAEAAPIGRGSVHLPGGRAVAFALPAPAWGLSRARLDHLLACRAAARGAEVLFGARVVAVEETRRGRVRVRFARAGSGEKTVLARTAVGAWGRWNALDRALDRRFAKSSRRFFGWSADYDGRGEALRGEARLYLFPGGYCGLSPIEGGAVHLAGVIAEAALRKLPSGWDHVVAHARRGNRALDRDMGSLSPRPGGGTFLGTGPVFFTRKPAAEGRLLMVGDAAGVLDPFLGEGLSIALASGLLAAETLERVLRGAIAPEAAPRMYARAWRDRFAARTRRGAAFRALMLHPAAARLAAALLGRRIVALALTRSG